MLCVCVLLLSIAITTIILTNAAVYDYKAVEISGLSDIEPSSEDIMEFHKFLETANNSAYDQIPIFGYYPELIQNPMITEFRRGGICPYIIPVPPLKKCWVYWDYCVRANLGNRHRRWYTAFRAPRVTWNGEEDALYTLIMHNPDVPIGNFSFRRWRPWVVGNIPGPCRVDDGFVLYDYNLDFKPIDTFQRHIFLVYKQEKPIAFDPRDVYKPRRLQRFNLTKFVYKYRLGNPEFGNFYYSFIN